MTLNIFFTQLLTKLKPQSINLSRIQIYQERIWTNFERGHRVRAENFHSDMGICFPLDLKPYSGWWVASLLAKGIEDEGAEGDEDENAGWLSLDHVDNGLCWGMFVAAIFSFSLLLFYFTSSQVIPIASCGGFNCAILFRILTTVLFCSVLLCFRLHLALLFFSFALDNCSVLSFKTGRLLSFFLMK